jgi:hypothetical protein
VFVTHTADRILMVSGAVLVGIGAGSWLIGIGTYFLAIGLKNFR